MIHGAGGGGWEYNKWRPVFEQAGYQVIAKDLLPEGDLSTTTLSDYVAQARAWLPSGDHEVVIIGASMGGTIALKLAEEVSPSALILINPATPRGIGKPKEFKAVEGVQKWANGPIEDSRVAMPDSDEETIQFAHKHWRDESGLVLNELRKGVEITRPKCRSLIIISGKDTDVPPENSRALAEYLGAHTLILKAASHVGPILGKSSEAVARKSIAWLKKIH